MSGGGKGGNSNQTVAYYFVPIAFAICEGPIVGIKQIWAGGDLIFSDGQPVAVNTYQGGGKKSGPTVSTSYQTFTSSTTNDVQTGGSALGPWTCYLGTETQPADPTIGEGVAYRGVAYIVFNPLNIGPGATVPPLTFEVVTVGALNPPEVVWGPVYQSPQQDAGINVIFDGDGNPIINGIYQAFKLSSATGSVIQAGQSVGAQIYLNCLAASPNGYYAYITPYSLGLFNIDTLSITPGVAYSQTGYYQLDNSILIYDGAYVLSGSYGFAFTPLPSPGGPTYTPQPISSQNSSLILGAAPTQYNGANWVSFVDGVLTFINGNIYTYNFATANLVTGPANVASACFDPSGNLWAVYTDSSGNHWLASLNPETLAVISQASIGAAYSFLAYVNGMLSGISGTSIVFMRENGTLFATLSITSITNSGITGAFPSPDGYLYLISGAGITKINPGGNVIIPGPMTLPAAVEILCQRAGITQYDVSQLPATEVNFVRADTVNARSMLDMLAKAYFFSMVDSGGTLVFVPWGQPAVATIPLEDLGYDKVTANAVTPFTANRISGVDLPRSVKIRYISAAQNWNYYEQIFALESYDSGKEVTLNLPLILADTDAYNIASMACTLPHAERMQYSFTTSYKWLAIEPGDVVRLPFGTCRIQSVKMGQKGGLPVLEFTACIDGINALAGAGYAIPALPNYQPNAAPYQQQLASQTLSATQTVGNSSPHPIAAAPQIVQTVANAGTAKLVLCEPPPLSSTDTGMRIFAGAYSTGNAFPGAAIFRSTDGGTTYTQWASFLTSETAGYANTVLPAPPPQAGMYTWDTESTVNVYLIGQGTLGPLTDLQVMNGGNGAMLGMELIQFAQATLMTDSYGNPYYQLSRLLRGRRGTEWAMGSHAVGDPFYLIPGATIPESYTAHGLNNPALYKVVMLGGNLTGIPSTSYEPSGASLMQWAVAHLSAVKDSSGDWVISWTPRARYNGEFASGFMPTLDSDTAGWSIDILSGTTVKRTIAVPLTQTAPWTTTYTAAMQSADGFTPGQTGIGINCYQLSASIGRGYVSSITTGSTYTDEA